MIMVWWLFIITFLRNRLPKHQFTFAVFFPRTNLNDWHDTIALWGRCLWYWYMVFMWLICTDQNNGTVLVGRLRSGTMNRVVTSMVFMGNFPMSLHAKFNKFVEIELSMCVMKAYRGSRIIAALIPNLGTRWMWVAIFTPRLPTRNKRTLIPCPLNSRLVGPQSWSGCFWEENKIRCPCWESNPRLCRQICTR